MKLVTISILTLLITTLSCFGQFDHENSTLLGHWAHGSYRTVCVLDTLAYYGCGASLRLFNYADVDNPVELCELSFPYVVSSIEVSGDYAFIAVGYFGLYIVDVSDSRNPTIISTYNMFHPNIVRIHNSHAFLLSRDEGLQILDISDPENPELIESYASEGEHRDIAFFDTTAYIVIDRAFPHLIALDISDPESIDLLGEFNISEYLVSGLRCINIQGSIAYLGGTYGLSILDVSNPEEIEFYDSYFNEAGDPDDLIIEENYLYTVSGRGFHIINVEDPRDAQIIADIDSFRTYEIAKSDDLIFTADVWGRYVIDVDDRESPQIVSHINDAGKNYSFAQNNDYLYLEEGNLVSIIDVSDPADLSKVYSGAYGSSRIKGIQDSLLFVEDDPFLHILNVAEPERTEILGTYEYRDEFYVGDHYEEICFYYPFIFVLYRNDLIIVDISDPSDPTLLDTFTEIRSASRVAVSDFIFLVGTNSDDRRSYRSFMIFDYHDPFNLEFVGELELDLNTYVRDIELVDDYAYLSMSSDGLAVVDISNPSDPVLISSIQFEEDGEILRVTECEVEGSYAYLLIRDSGVSIINVDDKEDLYQTGYFYFPGGFHGLSVENGSAYVRRSSSGVYIIGNDDNNFAPKDWSSDLIRQATVVSVHPNPFNAVTNVNINLPYPSGISIRLYDLNGRSVKSIRLSERTVGIHSLSLNTNKLPAGNYFINVITGNAVYTKSVSIVN